MPLPHRISGSSERNDVGTLGNIGGTLNAKWANLKLMEFLKVLYKGANASKWGLEDWERRVNLYEPSFIFNLDININPSNTVGVAQF